MSVPASPWAEPPPEPRHEERADRLQRRVAVLIMVVTLLGAIFAFLQTVASNQAAEATRRSDIAAVEAMGNLARGEERLAEQDQFWLQAGEDAALALSLLSAGGEAAPHAAALAQGLLAMRDALLPYFDLAQPPYLRPDGTVNRQGFAEDTLAPAYRAAEYQKAYAAERDGWAARGGICVAVVTVLAVALFLLGLSRTSVAAASGGGLLAGAGTGLALVAVVWGVTAFGRPVAPPSPEAIDAYVEGLVALGSVRWESDPAVVEGPLTRAEEAFSAALAGRADYAEAYLGRGAARFRLDFLRPGGPSGSSGAAEDFARAVSLNPLDPVARGNLGAARFWLGDLEGAGADTRRALALDPDDLTINLNLGLYLALVGDEAAYLDQSVRVAERAADDVPAWLRRVTFARFYEVLALAEESRPEYAAGVRRYREDLLRIDHQIEVSKWLFGYAVPPPTAVRVTPLAFTLSEGGTRLVATFGVEGVGEGQRWLWRTYRGGVEDPALSSEPEAWPFRIPDEPEVAITLDRDEGFAAAVPVRVEVFFEGNLVQAGEFTP